jgi:uncharacterized protein YprB with RNaseH-like and TPR domain
LGFDSLAPHSSLGPGESFLFGVAMSVGSRLSGLQQQAGVAARPPASKPSISTLREKIALLESRGRAGKNRGYKESDSTFNKCNNILLLKDSLDGDLVADGLIRVRRRIPLEGELGSTAMNILRGRPHLPGESSNAHRNVYIDTETTGLSGGSGTLAFLVGIAVVDAEAIELTQFLMTGFSAEAAALKAIADCLTPDDQLVSYNGKSYDLPLLMTRFRMQAMQHPFDGLPHLDLLHPVRRLFGKRWNDCRLITVEENLLGFHRIDDLPGSEAPEAWFSYIRHGDGGSLMKVVEHNQQDIVSLAVAHSVLTQAIEQPMSFDVDLYALARWLSEHNEDTARELLQSYSGALCDDSKRLLAHLLRRAGDWPAAITLWETLAARGCTDSLERLAKYHEHISKDLAAARRYCAGLPDDAAREHRRSRIDSKIAINAFRSI